MRVITPKNKKYALNRTRTPVSIAKKRKIDNKYGAQLIPKDIARRPETCTQKARRDARPSNYITRDGDRRALSAAAVPQTCFVQYITLPS
jgi:hypothetical protein